MERIYYENTSDYGPRQAIAIVLDVDISAVELEPSDIPGKFWIAHPIGASPDPAAVAAQAPPPPEPSSLTDVDRARQYAEAYAAAEQIIFLLMGRVAPALVVSGFFTPETVNAEGTRFMAFHRDLIIDFKNSGRHPDAGTALYNAIAATPSTTAFPWLLANGGAILSIFGNGLPRNA